MLKRILNKLLSPLTLLRDALLERSLGDLSERERFERIYKSGYWRPIIGGSLLGAGSNLNSTEEICEELPRFLDNYQIKSILDLPCGDWYWMSQFNLEGYNSWCFRSFSHRPLK